LPSSTESFGPPDVAGRLNAALRHLPPAVIYVAGAVWAVWLFWLGATGGLGAEPINALEREYGDVALKLLVAGLAVTPLRRFLGINLLRFRRAIGVTCFFFVLAHVLVWALLDLQSLGAMWADIVKRPYVTVGMAAFLMLIPLALTSNNLALRRMGSAAWRRLHKLTYPAAILGALHYLWIAKGFALEPLVYMGAILGLLALRLPLFDRRPTRTA
jgi:methionine sulfoxide reductase heme-binding subunit